MDLLELRNKVISIVSQLGACDQPSYSERSRQTGAYGIPLGLFLLSRELEIPFLECPPEQ